MGLMSRIGDGKKMMVVAQSGRQFRMQGKKWYHNSGCILPKEVS